MGLPLRDWRPARRTVNGKDPFEGAPGLLGLDLWKPMGLNLLGATDEYDVLKAGIRGQLIDYGASGHALLDPLEFGNLTVADFLFKYHLWPDLREDVGEQALPDFPEVEQPAVLGCLSQCGGCGAAAVFPMHETVGDGSTDREDDYVDVEMVDPPKGTLKKGARKQLLARKQDRATQVDAKERRRCERARREPKAVENPSAPPPPRRPRLLPLLATGVSLAAVALRRGWEVFQPLSEATGFDFKEPKARCEAEKYINELEPDLVIGDVGDLEDGNVFEWLDRLSTQCE